MQTVLALVLGLGLALSASAIDAPIDIVIGKDFPETSSMTINGTRVSHSHVLDELAKIHKDRGDDVSITIKMHTSLSFNEWDAVRILMGKIPFTNVRYFVFWPPTQTMIEIQQVGPLLDMQGKPSVNQ